MREPGIFRPQMFPPSKIKKAFIYVEFSFFHFAEQFDVR